MVSMDHYHPYPGYNYLPALARIPVTNEGFRLGFSSTHVKILGDPRDDFCVLTNQDFSKGWEIVCH